MSTHVMALPPSNGVGNGTTPRFQAASSSTSAGVGKPSELDSTHATLSVSSNASAQCKSPWLATHSSTQSSRSTNLKRLLDPLHVPETIGLVQPSWLPYTFPLPQKPQAWRDSKMEKTNARKLKQLKNWTPRHHVCESKDNRQLPRLQRSYFDDLPQVASSATTGHRSRNFDHFCLATTQEQYCNLNRRFERYPFVEAAREASAMIYEKPKISQESSQGGNGEECCDGTTGIVEGDVESTVEGGTDGNAHLHVEGFQEVHTQVSAEECTAPSPVGPDEVRTEGSAADSNTEKIGRRGTIAWQLDPEIHKEESGKEVESSPTPSASSATTLAHGKSGETCAKMKRRSSFVLHLPGSLTNTNLFQFEHWSAQKFGSLVRLWRCIDTHNNMKVGQGQFLRGLQDFGYSGDAKDLFKVLNRDQTGTLVFYHFYPQAALRIAELLHWARTNYGGLEGVGLMSTIDHNSRITRNQFKRLFKKKGWESDEAIDFAFELVDKDGNGSVDRAEIQLLDSWEFPEWLTADPDKQAADRLKALMLEKCQGSALRAWRLLDRSGSMRLSWHDFRQVLRKILPADACEKLAVAWRALDDDLSGWLSLREFDLEAYDCLASFWHWAQNTFGSVVAAFPKLHANDSFISYYEFRLNCKASGLGERVIDMIFEGLDVDGTGTISMNEVRFLDCWKVNMDKKEEQAWSKVARLSHAADKNKDDNDQCIPRKLTRLQSTDCVTADNESMIRAGSNESAMRAISKESSRRIGSNESVKRTISKGASSIGSR